MTQEEIKEIEKVTNHVEQSITETVIFPAKNFVTSQDIKNKAISLIKNELAFYRNMSVPQNADLYLDGAYEGRMQMENEYDNYSLMSIGGLTFKIVFVEGFKAKFYTKNLLFNAFMAGSKKKYELYDYHYEGNSIVWYNSGKKVRLKIKDGGYKLVIEEENSTVIFSKLY